MNINNQLNKFFASSAFSTALFVGSGAYQTYQDYRYAPKEFKDKFLIKDCVVLSGAALGMAAHQAYSSKLSVNIFSDILINKIAGKINSRKINQSIETSVKYTKEILRDVLRNFTFFTSGILGALGMDYLLTLTGFEQPEKYERKEDNSKLDNVVSKFANKETRSAVYSRITDMPELQMFTTSCIGAHALNLSKDKKFKDRLKNTTKCLLSNSFIPLLCLTITNSLTKKVRPILKVPIVFASLVGGTIISNRIFGLISSSSQIEK